MGRLYNSAVSRTLEPTTLQLREHFSRLMAGSFWNDLHWKTDALDLVLKQVLPHLAWLTANGRMKRTKKKTLKAIKNHVSAIQQVIDYILNFSPMDWLSGTKQQVQEAIARAYISYQFQEELERSLSSNLVELRPLILTHLSGHFFE